jgi:DNA-binding winged helix-turn-helix (wHTH) protein/tetratricopeptide (TPR) repeat protein
MSTGSLPEVSHLTPFKVGDWLVEPKACRVSRGDTVVKLRPQLMDLLVCLARRAGEIVLKDEILEAVWPGQYIAESGLSRCVAELRQSLHDDAHVPRVIETFPKRGYRLIAPVVWEEGAEVHVSTKPVPQAGWPRRLLLPGAMALLAVGITAIALLLRSPASALTERDTVLLADVRNTTRDQLFDDTLRLALAVNLGQAPFLRILPQEVVRGAVVRTGRSPEDRVVGSLAMDVCRREGAAVMLAGSIAPMGTRYAVGIEAIACGTGEEIGRVLVVADSKERVLDALGDAATQIRRRLGESRDSLRQHDVPLVRATTPSLEALKALTLGDYSRDHAQVAEALTFYRRATELDPQFAVAWARRGAAARNVSQFDEADLAFQRAYDLRDRASDPERFYIMAHYYRYVADDPRRAVETYQVWKQTYPGSPVPPTNLASLYIGALGQYEAGVTEGQEAVRLAPHSSIAHVALIRGLLGLGRISEAKQALRNAANRGAADQIWHAVGFEIAFLEGDAAGMDEHVRSAAGDAAKAMEMDQYSALAAACTGRFIEARRRWADASASAGRTGPPIWQAVVKLAEAEAEALLGDTRRARAAAEAALAIDERPFVLMAAANVMTWTGDVTRGRLLLDRFERRPVGGLSLRPVSLAVARALAELKSGQPARARELIRPASPFERSRDFDLLPLGVRASIELSSSQPAQAATTFREIVRLRGVAPMSPWVPFARLGLARALAAAGDVNASVAAYDAFLESWKNADADMGLLSAARQERAAIAR